MIKTLTCVDCRVEFTYDHRKGPTRQRCDPCTEVRRLATTRAKTARYRERWPDRSRDQWNKSNRQRLADPEYRRQKNDQRILRAYGITREQYDEMLANQGGLCAICRGERNGSGKVYFHIDHCHDSKKVRGLLCGKCNTAVGLLDDDPMRAEQLARYLRQ